MRPEELKKPAIKIYSSQQDSRPEILRQIFYGIEEEGIPFEHQQKTSDDAAGLAYEAGCASSLGVGVGISSREIVLHYEKLAREEPLFRIAADAGAARVRTIGTNSARLVKKMPFKE